MKFTPIVLFLLFFTTLFAQEEPKMKGCHMIVHDHEPVPGYFPNAGPDFRSDSMDILDYHIRVDVTNFGQISAHTTVQITPKMENVESVILDLLDLEVDSVFIQNEGVEYVYDGFQIHVPLETSFSTMDTFDVDVYYRGTPTIDPSGFGGLEFNSDYIYNLGIGLSSDPHNFGRSWYPCFDNFMERSTYQYEVTHESNEIAHCVGTELGTNNNGNGTSTTTYVMTQQIPTYLSSIAISDYQTIWYDYEGIESNYPIKLMGKAKDTTVMKQAFGHLPLAIEAFEDYYGPYVWERVGFVMTTVGAMEHPTNTAYPDFSIQNGSPDANLRLMAHELAHNWWGNLTTLSTEEDMWIKEGNAEYSAHLAIGYVLGEEEFLDAVRSNHALVLNSAHIDDEGFRALSGMPNEWTYGTTTYNKGASVMHNLKGYMGDENWKIGMNSILQNYAYSHLNATEFRDQLEIATGMNMDPFFDAWIFEPGFATYVVDSFSLKEMNGDQRTYTIYLQQKMYGTDKFHKEVPLTVDLLGADGQNIQTFHTVTGQFDQIEVTTDYDLDYAILNRDNLLNIARTDSEKLIDEVDEWKFTNTGININVKEIEDPIWVRVEHVYGAPDNNVAEGTIEINPTHYWQIDGEISASNHGQVDFEYNGKKERDIDYEFAQTTTEDELQILYRKDASEQWQVASNALQVPKIPDDKAGFFRVYDVVPGQYAIAKGETTVAALEKEIPSMDVYPNPVSEVLYVNLPDNHLDGSVRVFSNLGQMVFETTFVMNERYKEINLSEFHSGNYIITVENNQGVVARKRIVKI